MKEGKAAMQQEVEIPHEVVHGLYDLGWGDLIVDAAFAHPAKVSRKLAYWIVKQGIERGWWKPGVDTLLDPFCGIGGFGIAAAAQGMDFLGVELEENFCELTRENFALHEREWTIMHRPLPRVIQGDSRDLRRIVTEAVAGAVTSPPFTEAQSGGGINKKGYKDGDMVGQRTYSDATTQASDPANIARLPIGNLAAVTSPPYEEGLGHGIGRGRIREIDVQKALVSQAQATYGDSRDNIGNQRGDTYWSAVRQVYEQLYELFSPGSHAAIVVKSFVRKGKIVPLPQITLDLLTDIGFEPVLEVRAMLTEEAGQTSFDGVTIRKKRASFFRRLYEAKYPENAIDYEVVLVCRKPDSFAGNADKSLRTGQLTGESPRVGNSSVQQNADSLL